MDSLTGAGTREIYWTEGYEDCSQWGMLQALTGGKEMDYRTKLGGSPVHMTRASAQQHDREK